MKLILAIISDEDSSKVIAELSKNDFGVTKLATTGGFLRSGNMTLLIGTEDEKVQDAIDIIKEKCKKRTKVVATSMGIGAIGALAPMPVEVNVGGATIFVVDVDRFEKV